MLNCAALLVPKGTGPGVYTVTDPFGSKTGPVFFGSSVIGPDGERIDGTVSRSRVNKRPIRHDF